MILEVSGRRKRFSQQPLLEPSDFSDPLEGPPPVKVFVRWSVIIIFKINAM